VCVCVGCVGCVGVDGGDYLWVNLGI